MKVLNSYNNVNITDAHGVEDTETLVCQIQNRLEIEFGRKIDIEIWETAKYGIEIAGH